MKRIQHIFLLIISLLTVLSCADLLEGDYTSTEGKVTASISVSVPQLPVAHTQRHTRAMSMTPDVQNLYLAVFDNNGYLLEYVKATADPAVTAEYGYNYTVNLTPTEGATSIHFIGNGPESIDWGTEAEAIGRLYTEGGDEAYWEKLEFPNGLRKNGTGFDESVLTALQQVRLARNFAWIKLQKGDAVDNFEIDSYCVVNTNNRGSVAPYNTKTGIFEDFKAPQTYVDLVVNQKYQGFVPAGTTLTTQMPDESQWFNTTGVAADNYAYFIYEREKPSSNPTFIIMKGRYKPAGGDWLDTPRYYKVDLRDANGEYFPILRNFRYNIELTSILHEGHATAAAALAGAGSGDVSTSIETQSYTNISNNVARIFVSFTDTTLVNQTNELKLRYKFMAFETKDANGNILQEEEELNDENNVTIEICSPTAGGAVIQTLTRATSDDDNGWRELTIATTALEDFRKTQEIIIKGHVTIGEHTYNLQRKVILNLRPKYDMQLVCAPTEVQQGTGTPFDVVIKVPGGMGQAMFPLEFELEAEAQSMTPNGDDLPVVTGKSIVPGKETKTTIGFIKHLEWDVYDALPNVGGYKSVPCHFKTTKAQSATAIYADNKYFNQASTTLANYTPSTFSNLTFNRELPNKVDQDIEFTFTMSKLPSQGVVTVILDNLKPAEGANQLSYAGVIDGKAAYSFNPDDLTETLYLQNTAIGVEASVTLQAYHFTDASKSMTYTANAFQNLTFNPATLNTTTTGTAVQFSFDMTNMPTGPVTVALTNLKPATGESRLTPIVGKENTYTFTPTGLNNTLQLQNTATNTTGRVQLSATNFPNAEKTLTISNRYVIPAGSINLGTRPAGGAGTERTFTVYTSNTTNTSARIATFNTSWNSPQNPDPIELTAAQYQTVMNNDGKIYVKFTRSGTTYTASADLQTLLSGGTVVLDW